jgi:hypothetical protein
LGPLSEERPQMTTPPRSADIGSRGGQLARLADPGGA